MSDQANPNVTKPVRKWLGPVLLVSLVVNLFLVGAFAAGFIRDMDPKGRAHVSPIGVPHQAMVRQLSGEERDLLKAVMGENRAKLRPLFQELRQARLALSDAIAADPYDPDAVRAAFSAMRVGMDQVASQSQNALVDAFAELTPESRAKIADVLKRGPIGRNRGEGPREGRSLRPAAE